MKCAAKGCRKDPAVDPDTALFRINPKGHRPFIGLCQDHYRRPNVELEPEMAEILEEHLRLEGGGL